MLQTPQELRTALADLDRIDGGKALQLLATGTFSAQQELAAGNIAEGAAWTAETVDLVRALARRGTLDEWDATARIARLTGNVLRHAGDEYRDRFPLQPLIDDVVRLLPADPAAEAERGRRWRELPRPEIMRLRHTKNLVTALLAVEPYAPEISRIVEDWRDVLPHLP